MELTGQPPSSNESLDQQVLATIARFPDGCPDDELRKQFAQNNANEYVSTINSLLSSQKVEVLRSGSQLFYKTRAQSADDNAQALNPSESIVYQLIEDAGNRGIWVRDLKTKSNVPHPQFKKVLKSLENRKLVKYMTTVGASRQKVYLLYDLQPDDSVSGGTLYPEQQLDIQYVNIISKQCLKFLKQKVQTQRAKDEGQLAIDWEYVSSHELCDFINDLKISKVKLDTKEVEKIMDTLVYESALERTHSGGTKMYRIARPLFTPGGFSQSPCFFCPVFYDCNSNGIISPGSCSYFDKIIN
uniref:DNA-directed RNA polymerase III subunit RPC6 n=1 Tax=Trichuris muris TaxID=70415 RepID=A0A5S6Q4B8_TRIMR